MSFCFQPIRFFIFDKESMNRRLPVPEAAKGLDPWHSPEGSRPFGMGNAPFATSKVTDKGSCFKQTQFPYCLISIIRLAAVMVLDLRQKLGI